MSLQPPHPTEDAGAAALQPHDSPARRRVRDDRGINLGLLGRGPAAALAHIDALCRRRDVPLHRRLCTQVVVNHNLRLLEQLCGADLTRKACREGGSKGQARDV